MKTSLLVALVVALFAGHARAESRSAHLLGDAPKVLLGSTPRLLDSALAAADVKDTVAANIGFGEHFAKTSAVGMASSLTGVLLGAGLGVLSNNLIGAAIPVLLANLFLPPILTVLMAMLVGNWETPGRFGFWLPLAGAFVVNAAAYVIASLVLVVPWTNPAALLLYCLVDGLLMGGATVGIMHLTEKKKPGTITSFVPGVSDTTFVSMMKVNL
ncbi:MAG: hypothetical protein Q8L48_12840 [Archangium sp.]|nr:hypothetical protein [Archangium sp.]